MKRHTTVTVNFRDSVVPKWFSVCKLADADFDEEKHKRSANGQFSSAAEHKKLASSHLEKAAEHRSKSSDPEHKKAAVMHEKSADYHKRAASMYETNNPAASEYTRLANTSSQRAAKSSNLANAAESSRGVVQSKPKKTDIKHAVPSGKIDNKATRDIEHIAAAYKELPELYTKTAPGLEVHDSLAHTHAKRAGGMLAIDKNKYKLQISRLHTRMKADAKDNIAHEIAHYHDDTQGSPSQSREFATLLAKTVSGMSENAKNQFAYAISSPEEAWAHASSSLIAPHFAMHVAASENSGFTRAAKESGMLKHIENFYKSKGLL